MMKPAKGHQGSGELANGVRIKGPSGNTNVQGPGVQVYGDLGGSFDDKATMMVSVLVQQIGQADQSLSSPLAPMTNEWSVTFPYLVTDPPAGNGVAQFPTTITATLYFGSAAQPGADEISVRIL
jgi:hypothetical protein